MSAVSDNLGKRIKTATNKISGSTLASNRTVRQTVSRRNTRSRSRSGVNSINTNNTNTPINTINRLGKSPGAAKNGIPANDFDDPEAGITDPFENPVLLTFILLITFGFIAYGLYYYYKSDTDFKQGQTFYGADVLAYEPLFTLDTDKIDKCIDRCQKDSTCAGVTFNTDTLTCTGTEEGQLRDDNSNYVSWVKPKSITDATGFHNKIVGVNTDKPIQGFANSFMTIKNTEFARPPFNSRFNFSVFLYINDFYEGHGRWRNIICKGTQWPPGEPLDTPYWETVVDARPDQCLGIWLAPFNNNLRICLTTRRQPSVVVQPSTATPSTTNTATIIQSLEYIDIQNIPTRKLFHLSVNMVEGGMEVYLNGKLHRMITLKGAPVWNNLPMTLFGQTSTPATILDLIFIPDSADLDDIRAQTRKLDEYSEKLMNTA
jgi:hypothetical protein